MKQIDISSKKYPNTFALVDDEDFEWVNQWKWWRDKLGYAVRKEYIKSSGYGKSDYKYIHIKMHSLVNNTSKGFVTDHINRDRLDNRKSNLRNATKSQNGLNVGLRKNNTSGYDGVHWYKSYQKYVAYIRVNNKRVHLGYFDNIQGAWLARRWGERLYWRDIR